ncbi:MAG: hypothetical protein ACLSAF_20065 [Intestinimonas sp.]
MNENDEAQYVASQILTGFSQGRKWRPPPPLYRMNAQSNQIEQAFQAQRRPPPHHRRRIRASSTGREVGRDALASPPAPSTAPPTICGPTGSSVSPRQGNGQKTADTAQTLAVQGGEEPSEEIIKNALGLPRSPESCGQAGPSSPI